MTAARHGYPARLVCLTEETTEILYRIGAGDLVVGVSGYTVRPPEAREKPKVSAFITAKYDKILALKPDLVLAFSDLQAEIAKDLIKKGVPVFTFNQRSVAEILMTVRMLGGLVGYHEEAEAFARELEKGLERVREKASKLPRRPRVYFEEWDEPMISGIRWVSELVEIAEGQDQVGLQGQDLVVLGRNKSRDLGLEPRLRRPDRVARDPHDKIPRPDMVQDLGGLLGEADEAGGVAVAGCGHGRLG